MMITNSEELKASRVASAEAAVDAAKAKIVKLEGHLDGAHDALAVAEAELAAVHEAEHVYVAPGEHVVAHPQ